MSKLKDKQFTNKGQLYPFLKRLMGYSLRYPKFVVGFIFFVLLVAAIESMFPVVWKNLLDNVVTPYLHSGNNEAADLSGLWKYSLMMFGMGILLSLFVFCFINCAGRIQEFVMYDIRQELFIKLQNLQFSFFDKSAVGWLLSRISSDTIKVTELVSWAMIECVWGIGMIIFCAIAMFIQNWKLAIIVCLTVPMLTLVSVKIRLMILRFSREARKHNSEMTARYNEHINGIEVNKSLVQEERVSEEFAGLSEKMRTASYKSALYSAIYLPLVIFGGSISAAVVIYYGGNMVVKFPPDITVGTLAAFFGYATLMFEPILDISRFYSQAQGSISAGERIFSLVDTPILINDKDGSDNFSRINGEIEFENVSFYYEEDKKVILNMNLKIEAGHSVALVGETGGGKSTIINLIGRFYEPTTGRIKIDGIDYKEKTMASLRSQLGIVLQTPHLFSGTIKENVQYGREDANDTDILEALRLVGATDFISRLNEQVGEGGENLSMGEKQLVSFTRAVLANPRIFIMDEATSSVDTLTEAVIQKGIATMMKERTSIIIAHRLSTIKHCDRILVIERGQITEDGSHKELMRRKGHYYNLYTRQLRDEREKELLNI